MIKKAKNNHHKSDIISYFAIALVTVSLMAVSPILNKGIYAKSTTVPSSVAVGEAIDAESTKTLKEYVDIQNGAKEQIPTYLKANKKFLKNNGITEAKAVSPFEGYNGPRNNMFYGELIKEAALYDPEPRGLLVSGNEDTSFGDLLEESVGLFCAGPGVLLASGWNAEAPGRLASMAGENSIYLTSNPQLLNSFKNAALTGNGTYSFGAAQHPKISPGDVNSAIHYYNPSFAKKQALIDKNVLVYAAPDSSAVTMVRHNKNLSENREILKALVGIKGNTGTDPSNTGPAASLVGGIKWNKEVHSTDTNPNFSPKYAYSVAAYARRDFGKDNFVPQFTTESTRGGGAYPGPQQIAVWRSDYISHTGGPLEATLANMKGAQKGLKEGNDLDFESSLYSSYVAKLREFVHANQNVGSKEQRLIVDGQEYHSAKTNSQVVIEKSPGAVIRGSGSISLRDPQIKYYPSIKAGEGSDMDKSSTVRFDSKTQKWIIGPYKLNYLSVGLDKKKFAGLGQVRLFGQYEGNQKVRFDRDIVKPENRRANRFDKEISKTNTDLKSDEHYSEVKSWQFVTKGGELATDPSKGRVVPNPNEEFYITIDYDPTLKSIDKARFEFAYMVHVAAAERYTGTYNALSNFKFIDTQSLHHTEVRELKYDKSAPRHIKGTNYGGSEITPVWLPRPTDQERGAESTVNPRYKPYWGSETVVDRNPSKPGGDRNIPVGTGGTVPSKPKPGRDRNIPVGRSFVRDGSGATSRSVTSSDSGGTSTRVIRYTTWWEGYDEAIGYHIKNNVRKSMAFNYTNTNRANQTQDIAYAKLWYEEIALEVKFNEKDLNIPLGGVVWEEQIKNDRKHVGFDHVLAQGEKGVEGVRVRVHRNIARVDAKGKVVEILRKERARLFDRKTGEYVKDAKIYTDESGKWGGYDIKDLGFTKEERTLVQNDFQNHRVIFDVTFDYDGVIYEPVQPLGQKDSAALFANGESVFNDTPTSEKGKYRNTSFAMDDPDNRDEYNARHAEISSDNVIDVNGNTAGKSQGVDANGNRTNESGRLDYSSETKSESNGIVRKESKYIVKKTKDREIDDVYFYDFMEASTLNIGMNILTSDKVVYTFDKEDKGKPFDGEDFVISNEYKNIAGKYLNMSSYVNNINMGLKRRGVDADLTKDLNSAVVISNRKMYQYLYNTLYDEFLSEEEKAQGLGRIIDLDNDSKDIGKLQSKRDQNRTQRLLDVYKTDYIYRTSMHSSNAEVKKLLDKEIEEERKSDSMRSNGSEADKANNTKADTRKLDIFLIYKTSISNSSTMDALYISGIKDAYSNKLELVQTNVEKHVQLDRENVEQNGQEVDGKKVKIPTPKYRIHKKGEDIQNLAWNQIDSTNTKDLGFAPQTVNVAEYTISETGANGNKQEGMLLYPGDIADIFTTYRVKEALSIQDVQDKNALGELKEKLGEIRLLNALQLGDFTSMAEISAFASYNVLTGKFTGKVDMDSVPGNFAFDKQSGNFIMEDDTDEAAGINIRIPEKQNSESPEDTERKIEGKVWEDKQNILNQGVISGNGTLDKDEKGIPGQPVILEERISFNRLNFTEEELKNLRYASKNGSYVDVPFIWQENIDAKDIKMNLKDITGFESVIKTDENGNYTFRGVPAGNFVVTMNYSAPSVENIKKEFAKVQFAGKEIPRALEKAEINEADLIRTHEADKRNQKYYNGEAFKSTLFYGGDEKKLNLTWVNKGDKETGISLARDDEARRVEISGNLNVVKNNIESSAFAMFKEQHGADAKAGIANRYTSMRTVTPKINMAVEFYEKAEKQEPKSVILNELKDIYYVNGTYVKGKADKDNVPVYDVKAINIGIVERPQTKIVTNKEITNIVLSTADGKEIVNAKYNVKAKISGAELSRLANKGYADDERLFARAEFTRELDTENSVGIDTLIALDREQLVDGKNTENKPAKSGFRYISVDEDLLQGATINVRYGIFAYNLSQKDRKIDNITDDGFKLDSEENVNIFRELAYQTGENSSEGKIYHETIPEEFGYGQLVGKGYYSLQKGELAPEDISKVVINEMIDAADNGTTVKDDEENISWRRASKDDLVDRLEGLRSENKNTFEVKDENGVKYLEEANGKVVKSNIMITKEPTKPLLPLTEGRNYTYQHNAGYVNKVEDESIAQWNIRLDRTISANTDKGDLIFANAAEVLSYHTDNGRIAPDVTGRLIDEIGKEDTNTNSAISGEDKVFKASSTRALSSSTEAVTLSTPTGLSELQNKQRLALYMLIGGSIFAVTTMAIVIGFAVIKRKQ